ncbi:MAG TPA: hypothetical protein VLJ39_08935 [Tepidisphaeraceae bacterium]|jgi:hypothetical protein|nr:hypothetical protein [Tepidisphaeraceae bacterium]
MAKSVDPPPAATVSTTVGPAVPLAYESLSRQPYSARRIRWIILLAAALLAFVALLANPLTLGNESFGWGILGTPLGPIESLEGSSRFDDRIFYLIHAVGFLSLFLLSEWLFLLPRGRLRLHSTQSKRSRLGSIVSAAFIGMLLTAGLVASVMELMHVWQDVLGAEWHPGGLLLRGLYAFWAAMLLAWAVWAVVFYWLYRDADHETMVARITRTLIAGTILELLISVPAYVRSVQDPDNCYCARGSYTGLVFGCTAVFWLFGPGVYLLLLRERRRFTPKV